MRIESGVIGMESARRYQSSKIQRNRFRLEDYNKERTDNNTYMSGESLDTEEFKQEAESKTGEHKAENIQSEEIQTNKISPWEERLAVFRQNNLTFKESFNDTATQFRYYSTRYILMLLFGERAKSIYQEELFNQDVSMQGAGMKSTLEVAPMKQVSFTNESYYEETENVLYKSTGKVTTADGREITFHMELGMSRRFREYYKEEYNIAELQRVCDPLVISLNGNVAQLSDQKFFFDIDADGKLDEISELAAGSGYLALDQNNDGTINDGSELFGPQTGDGFADLTQYDEDGNGWIDEGDSVWNKLKIWCRNEAGENELYTLAEKGVGAICLQKAATDFSLKDARNKDKGFIRSTGIFLYENGDVGALQHLDLVR